ncbi:MAG: hypothetical protein JST93_19815 [Acidobacteria bacterium]|nr:hypothetical protein [Acidobacteriota bacterium]
MESFTKLFGSLLVFVCHCFDRIVINGYLEHLSRPGQVVHFFREVLGIRAITKEALGKRTAEYRRWVEAFARKQGIPMQWAEKRVRKEDFVLPYLKKMEKQNRYGVYFIFQSMEQGATFRSTAPRFPVEDPDYRILAQQRSRFMHYYFYIRDEHLGPMVIRVATFLPFQTTYYLNGHSFIEAELKRCRIAHRKDDNAFLSVADPAALQAAADRLTAEVIRKSLDRWTLIVGPKFSKREQHSINVRRAYYVHQIEYCRNFIFKRNFPIHKLFERSCELLHGGTQIAGWSTRQIHEAVLATFELSSDKYSLNQLRYDLRKLKAHGLLQRDGKRYAYRLSDKGASVALLFLFFHKQLCGPLANSRFHHRPNEKHHPNSRIEAAYRKADAAIQQVVDLLAA